MSNKLQPEIVHCSGSSYEIGRHYGEARRENIRYSVERYFALLRNEPWRTEKPAAIVAAMNFLATAKRFAPEEIEFLNGQAEGARISFAEAFALRTMLEVMFTFPSATAMCTSFAVTGNATKGGVTLLGQNIDWYCHSPIDLLHITRNDGYDEFAIYLFSVPYYFLTSAGLANNTNMTINRRQPSGTFVPVGFYLPQAMRLKNIGEAMEVLKQTAKGYGYFHLADAEGHIVGLESVSNHFTEIHPTNDVLVHANHYETEQYRESDMWEQILPCSPARALRLRELIDKHYGTITIETMMQLLRDHKNHPVSLCRHADPKAPVEMQAESSVSVIMIPKERQVFFTIGPPCENEYIEYRL